MNQKKHTKILLIGLISWLLGACSLVGGESASNEEVPENQVLQVGAAPGPYVDLFLEEVAPKVTEETGYEFELVEFSNPRFINVGIDEGTIDLSVDENYNYIQNYNKEAGSDQIAAGEIPTIPMIIYPGQKDSFEALGEGDQVLIPEDPSNHNRALLILESEGLIKLDPEKAEEDFYTTSDIVENTKKINIQEITSSSIPQSLQDAAIACVPGSVANDAGYNFDDAIAYEEITPGYKMHLLVGSSNADKDWLQVILDTYESEEVTTEIQRQNEEKDNVYWDISE